MTKINNGFSLFDFCKKRADKLQIYGEETLDEEGNIIPFIDQAALITHYLQLRNKNVNIPYEQQAKGCGTNLLRGNSKRNQRTLIS